MPKTTTVSLYASGTDEPRNFVDYEGRVLGPTLGANCLGQIPLVCLPDEGPFRLVIEANGETEELDPFYPDPDLAGG